MEAKFLAGALSFLSIFLAIYAQSLGDFEHFDSEASTEFEIEPAVIYYGDSNVNVGEPFKISCIIPITDKIHWLKDGEPITRHNLRHGRDEHAYTLEESEIEGEKHKIEAHISVRHALNVHEGRYQCNEKHSTSHMLHVRNVSHATKPQTKSPFLTNAVGRSGGSGDERHYPTESGYQTINELTPSTLDGFFTRVWERPGGEEVEDRMLPEVVTTSHHSKKQKEQKLKERERGREHERRKHLYANATLAHGGLNANMPSRSGESNEMNELSAYALPTSKYNDLTTMPWHVTHTSTHGGASGRGSVGGGSINRIYSATPPDFPPPRLNMLDHTVAPPDAPEIFYSGNMPHHTGTHQHMITANNPGGGGGSGYTLGTGVATETQPQQMHYFTVAPGQQSSGMTHTDVVTHHAHAHQQPQLTHHHHQQQQQQQQYPHTQLQAPQPPYQTYQPQQVQPAQQPPAPPYYHQYNQQQTSSSAYPPQFATAIAFPTGGVMTSLPATPAATLTTSFTPFGTMQQAKTILPLKKESDALEPNYDHKEKQLKFFEIRSPLVLSCGVKGNASLDKITWFLNETAVQEVPSLKGRYRLIPAEGKFIIDKTVANDDGLYQCKYENLKRDINVVAHIVVRVPSNSGVVEGEKLSVVCSVVGTAPILSWKYGNLTLTNSTGRYILKPDDNKVENAILSIENISLDDRGEYHCFGNNDATKYGNYSVASDVSTVRVKGKLAALWPFLGICAEVLILCLIILIYEKRRNKSELEESDTDPQEQAISASGPIMPVPTNELSAQKRNELSAAKFQLDQL